MDRYKIISWQVRQLQFVHRMDDIGAIADAARALAHNKSRDPQQMAAVSAVSNAAGVSSPAQAGVADPVTTHFDAGRADEFTVRRMTFHSAIATLAAKITVSLGTLVPTVSNKLVSLLQDKFGLHAATYDNLLVRWSASYTELMTLLSTNSFVQAHPYVTVIGIPVFFLLTMLRLGRTAISDRHIRDVFRLPDFASRWSLEGLQYSWTLSKHYGVPLFSIAEGFIAHETAGSGWKSDKGYLPFANTNIFSVQYWTLAAKAWGPTLSKAQQEIEIRAKEAIANGKHDDKHFPVRLIDEQRRVVLQKLGTDPKKACTEGFPAADLRIVENVLIGQMIARLNQKLGGSGLGISLKFTPFLLPVKDKHGQVEVWAVFPYENITLADFLEQSDRAVAGTDVQAKDMVRSYMFFTGLQGVDVDALRAMEQEVLGASDVIRTMFEVFPRLLGVPDPVRMRVYASPPVQDGEQPQVRSLGVYADQLWTLVGPSENPDVKNQDPGMMTTAVWQQQFKEYLDRIKAQGPESERVLMEILAKFAKLTYSDIIDIVENSMGFLRLYNTPDNKQAMAVWTARKLDLIEHLKIMVWTVRKEIAEYKYYQTLESRHAVISPVPGDGGGPSPTDVPLEDGDYVLASNLAATLKAQPQIAEMIIKGAITIEPSPFGRITNRQTLEKLTAYLNVTGEVTIYPYAQAQGLLADPDTRSQLLPAEGAPCRVFVLNEKGDGFLSRVELQVRANQIPLAQLSATLRQHPGISSDIIQGRRIIVDASGNPIEEATRIIETLNGNGVTIHPYAQAQALLANPATQAQLLPAEGIPCRVFVLNAQGNGFLSTAELQAIRDQFIPLDQLTDVLQAHPEFAQNIIAGRQFLIEDPSSTQPLDIDLAIGFMNDTHQVTIYPYADAEALLSNAAVRKQLIPSDGTVCRVFILDEKGNAFLSQEALTAMAQQIDLLRAPARLLLTNTLADIIAQLTNTLANVAAQRGTGVNIPATESVPPATTTDAAVPQTPGSDQPAAGAPAVDGQPT